MDVSAYDLEPNIRKARFIVSGDRIYTLEFDSNIEMKALKYMIQIAAHLRKNNFRLFSEGQEYTQCNDETFDEVFPGQKLIVFSLEKGEGEVFDETELLLQINSPCPDHSEKFLLFYCFNCGCSCCSECFLNGKHKGHKVQDKCYYLLGSRFLVEKMFEGWSSKPYDDYQISTDLTELRKRLDNVLFKQLADLLKQVQDKCNDVIDCYNQVNNESLANFRDSIRDVKLSCIKVLDELKEKYNIKDIVNSPEIFVNFHKSFLEIGNDQNNKLRQNHQAFQELNHKVAELVTNLVNSKYEQIFMALNNALKSPDYEKVKSQITQKYIGPVDQNAIIQHYSGHKENLAASGNNVKPVKGFDNYMYGQ